MKMARRFVGVDLGAGSGRVMLGTLDAGRLQLEEVHRFPNEPLKIQRTLYWNLLGLLREVQTGIAICGKKTGGEIHGIGVDTWGVDFGLLDRKGGLLAPPVHYRDQRTEGMMEEVFRKIPRATVFEETGIQFMVLNSLYQLAAIAKHTPEVLDVAGKMLLIADLVHYFLTGRAVAELTLATTSQVWNPRKNCWSMKIADAVGIPQAIFPDVIQPATVVANLLDDVTRETSLKGSPPVIACGTHDTASAIAAVPATGKASWGYLSSGTWSLLGVELLAPKVTPEALEHNFTNEGGVAGTTRFLKNINGLWLVQECRRIWAREGEDIDYGRLTQMAEAAGASRSFILPAAPSFFAPDDMPQSIRDFCRATGQHVPESKGEVVRCALESLALAYREVAGEAEKASGKKIEVLHIVGGGSRNGLLNQLTSNALGVPVLAGPVEATAIGNILVQAMATGDVKDMQELRNVVRSSVELKEYSPKDRAAWDEKYATYRKLAEKYPQKKT